MLHTPKVIYYGALYLHPRYWQWIPSLDWNWGESTHFVHLLEDDEEYSKYPDGKPLNREWSISLQWLFLYASLTAETAHPDSEEIV